ncbi:MAG: D-glycero-alpha-D-manno-heptose-1,7-bisphosphate 7-phosphatase [Promethearchaeota archaeon]
MSKKKAIILDRDGTIIEDKNYTYKIEDLELLPGVIDGLKLLQKDFIFFIITNQSGIGRGYYTVEDFHKFNNYLINKLNEHSIKIENSYFCPHLKEDNCDCRKPKTKFIEIIVADYHIDIKSSWMIGDHPSDVLCGINAGCRTVFLLSGHGQEHLHDLKKNGIFPDIITNNFLKAAEKIIKNSKLNEVS